MHFGDTCFHVEVHLNEVTESMDAEPEIANKVPVEGLAKPEELATKVADETDKMDVEKPGNQAILFGCFPCFSVGSHFWWSFRCLQWCFCLLCGQVFKRLRHLPRAMSVAQDLGDYDEHSKADSGEKADENADGGSAADEKDTFDKYSL